MAKVKLRHIPYRGSAPALQGLLAGDVDLMFDNLGVSLPLVEAGKLKLLAVASSERLPALPDVPTIAETLPGFEAVAWYGIVAPPKTPKNIIDKINADVNEALRQPEVQEQLKKLSAETIRRLGRQDVQIHARGGRPLGRGDQVGQYRAAIGRLISIRVLRVPVRTGAAAAGRSSDCDSFACPHLPDFMLRSG